MDVVTHSAISFSLFSTCLSLCLWNPTLTPIQTIILSVSLPPSITAYYLLMLLLTFTLLLSPCPPSAKPTWSITSALSYHTNQLLTSPPPFTHPAGPLDPNHVRPVHLAHWSAWSFPRPSLPSSLPSSFPSPPPLPLSFYLARRTSFPPWVLQTPVWKLMMEGEEEH